jgi:hypothetical protein
LSAFQIVLIQLPPPPEKNMPMPTLSRSIVRCAPWLGACLLSLAATAAQAAEADSPVATEVCLTHKKEAHAGASMVERREAMAREIQSYQSLVEEALSLRARAIVFHRKLQQKAVDREPLTGADLQSLNEGADAMLSQRQALLEMAARHECWTAEPPGDNPK